MSDPSPRRGRDSSSLSTQVVRADGSTDGVDRKQDAKLSTDGYKENQGGRAERPAKFEE